jgi:hypothetical protein
VTARVAGARTAAHAQQQGQKPPTLTLDLALSQVLDDLPESCVDFIIALLLVDTSIRLGSGGIEEVKAHPFFYGLDFQAVLAKTVEPPVPQASEVGLNPPTRPLRARKRVAHPARVLLC